MSPRPGEKRPPGLREVLLALYFAANLAPVVDYDVWLHLAAGREMWATGTVLTADAFTHTVPGAAWVYHEWLAALFIYGLFALAGVNGLVVFKAVMMTATMAVLLGIFKERGHGRGPAALCALLAAMVASGNVALERPHLFTMLFLSFYVYWLTRQRESGRPLPWTMVPIMALWANLHGGFILGLLAFGPFVVEDFWRLRSPGETGETSEGMDERRRLRESAPARIRRSLALGVCCTAATLVNPYGVETLLYPLQYAQASPYLTKIDEWASPDFQRQVVLEAVLLALAGAVLLSRRPVGLADGILALASAHLILTGVRNSFLVGPFVAPGCLDHLDEFFHRPGLQARIGRRLRVLDAGRFGPLLALVAVASSIWALASPPRVAPDRFPKEAVEWMRRELPPGRLFNDYDFGGYLMFELPRYPVFVDGRMDVHSRHGSFDDYWEVWRLSPSWETVLERRGVGVVLLERRQALAALLRVSDRWELAHEDDVAAVFVRVREATR